MTFTGLAYQTPAIRSVECVTPIYWQWRRLKSVSTINRAVLPENTDPDLEFDYIDVGAVTKDGGIGTPERLVFEDAPSRARRLVVEGDTIVSMVRTYLRAIAYITGSAEGFVVSTGFATITPGTGIDPRFLFWWLRSTPSIEEIVTRSVGVSYPAVNASDVGDIGIAVPPLDEQQRIAKFLDGEMGGIDELITEQEQLLRRMNEHHYAFASAILGAHIGGDSRALEGALSVLPSSWHIVPLKHLSTIQSGVTLGKRYEEAVSEYPYLRVANVRDGVIDTNDVAVIAVPPATAERHLLLSGDVLMTEGGDNDKLGRGSIWDGSIDPCLHQNHIFAVRTSGALSPRFLAALLSSAWGRAYFTATAHQATNLASTNRSKVGNFPIPLPPRNEQEAIMATLDRETERVSAVVNEVEHQMDFLRDHRQALITAAVSGQLDLRRSVV